ncbi:STY0301 family protein [Massilia eburnea]|uniref:STY0301 family protein n=1 Tax=Massilia eburnea TaxID=1776165 RepID=UPI003530C0CD
MFGKASFQLRRFSSYEVSQTPAPAFSCLVTNLNAVRCLDSIIRLGPSFISQSGGTLIKLSYPKFLAAVALLFLLEQSRGSGNQDLNCPTRISGSSMAFSDITGDWLAFIALPLYLHSVAPTDGPPERLGQLMGKQVRTNGMDSSSSSGIEVPKLESLQTSLKEGVHREDYPRRRRSSQERLSSAWCRSLRKGCMA